jgi:hypothetical protein
VQKAAENTTLCGLSAAFLLVSATVDVERINKQVAIL